MPRRHRDGRPRLVNNYTSGRYDDAAMQDRGWGSRGFNGSGRGGGRFRR